MKYKIKKNILWRAIDGEVVIVGENAGQNCYLNKTGSEVWRMIDEGLPFDVICDKLAKTYKNSTSEIEQDIKVLIDDLISSRLIDRTD